MKNLQKLSKAFIVLSTTLIIACSPTDSKQEAVAKTKEYDPFADFENLNKNFATHFEEMEKLMEKQRQQHRKLMQEAFKNADSKNSSLSSTSVKSNEDEENFYYELQFSGVKKEEINVALKDNILNFSATQKTEKNKKFSAANFYYSLTVGDFDRSVEPEIARLEDRIIVKLKKNKKK